MHGGMCNECAAKAQPKHSCPACAPVSPMEAIGPLMPMPMPMPMPAVHAEKVDKADGEAGSQKMRDAAKQLLKKLEDIDFDKVVSFDMRIEMSEDPMADKADKAEDTDEAEDTEEAEEADEAEEENQTHSFA